MNRKAFLLPVFVAAQVSAWATPVAIGINDFSGSETVIDFNAIGNEQQVGAFYLGSGVVFSNSLYGMTNPGDLSFFPNNGGVIASNWRYSQNGADSMFILGTFSSPQERLGFWASSNAPDDVNVTVYNGEQSLGTVSYESIGGLFFVGLENVGGFTSFAIEVEQNDNGFLAIDDFRFEGLAPAAVPEAGSAFLLLSLSAAALGVAGRRLKA